MERYGLVYGALHVSGLWYVGSTTQTLYARRTQHLAQSTIPVCKFHVAISETYLRDWVWVVLRDNIPQQQLRHEESQYQLALDSVNAGFNSTYACKQPGRLTLKQVEVPRPDYQYAAARNLLVLTEAANRVTLEWDNSRKKCLTC